jgi:CHAT domain-containing protein
LAEAETALNNGIKAFDEDRAATSDEGHTSANDESWQLFETAVHLALKKGDLPKAFAMAERARVRSLAEAKRQPAARTLKDVESSVEKDEAIVALNQFDDELAIWLIKSGGTSVIMRPLSRVDADRLVARQRDEIRLESSNPEASAALYNEILKPVQAGLKDVAHIMVVPDVDYQDLAFSGLWDASRRRFLIEDVSVSLAPSASALVARARTTATTEATLVVGGPDANSDRDAKAIASAYPSAELLDGNAATSSAVFASAQGRSVIHIAARMSDNEAYPLLSRLTLADEPGRRYSGVVLGREIAARSFNNTRLVVLGGSDTSDHSDETRGTLNVARAFLTAGVPSVLGTLPGMDETQSRDLLVGFHRRLSTNASPAEALTSLQRSVLGTNGRRLGAWCALVLYSSDR